MKKSILFFFLNSLFMLSIAQDVIIMRNGDEIKAKVYEITSSDVKYKKFSNLNGPTYTCSKSDIFMIKYKNGDKDVFEKDLTKGKNKQQKDNNQKISGQIPARPATDNKEIIAKYNKNIRVNLKPSNKDAKHALGIMGVTSNSILSTDEIEIRIVPAIFYKSNPHFTTRINEVLHYIEIHNKTNNIIFIDKGNSFRIYNNDVTECYYSQNQVSISSGNSSSIGIGVGAVANTLGIRGVVGSLANGVNVGGSNYGVTTDTYIDKRILSIPPHSKVYLTEYNEVETKAATLITYAEYNIISTIEKWDLILYGQRGILKKGAALHFSEENTIYKNKYYITYSTSPNFENYSVINFNVYLRELLGEVLNGFTHGCYGSAEALKKAYKKSIPDFWDDPYIITAKCDDITKK